MHTPKKSFGQNFLTDDNIARKIVSSLQLAGVQYKYIIEAGPGKGRLTKQIIEKLSGKTEIFLVELDKDLIELLKKTFPDIQNNIIFDDILKIKMETLTNNSQFGLIGNFPYNITGPLLFKILEYRYLIPEVVGMFQKEVVQRVASEPGNKVYGIPSVMMQAYYKVENLFQVNENVFSPRPTVKSAVLRLSRKHISLEGCNDDIFKMTVKSAFSSRRKTLKNSMSSLIDLSALETVPDLFKLRAEQLSVNDFIDLAKFIEEKQLLKKH